MKHVITQKYPQNRDVDFFPGATFRPPPPFWLKSGSLERSGSKLFFKCFARLATRIRLRTTKNHKKHHFFPLLRTISPGLGHIAISTYNCPYLGKLLAAVFAAPPCMFVVTTHIWHILYSNFFFQNNLAGSAILALPLLKRCIFCPIKKLKMNRNGAKTEGIAKESRCNSKIPIFSFWRVTAL